MEPDTADILGQRTMPVTHRNSSIRFSFSPTWLTFFIVALSVCYAVGVRLWRRFLLWRERSYKLATRRRYGIPDNDLRPFNVAYTDALMRAREEELAISRPPLHSQVSVVSGAQGEAVSGHTLRQRSVANTSLRSTTVPVPGGYSSRYSESMPPPAHHSADDLLPNGHALANTHVRHASSLNRRAAHQLINAAAQVGTSTNEARKRSWHTDQDEEHEAKKTRVEGAELIDGDEDAEFDENALELGLLYEGGSDAATETRKSSGRRARRVSAEKTPEGHRDDQNMDVDDEEMDDITELKPISRGKKRDRAEAGSTFGGDDEDSTAEHEGDSKLRRRRRKRRTVAKRKSEASHLRGKKREREGDEDLTDGNSEESLKLSSSQRKRGKRSSNVHHYEIERQKSDVSMDDSVASSKNKLREIGEEWENNGIRYKIGPNGQRLRQALVKKARQRFIMPKDSQHPDRDANMQVCIECWLTEEDYQQAKADHLLAWQDSPKQPEDGEKLSLDTSQRGVPFPQGIPGKNLLWSASASTTPTISPASHSPSESGQEIPQQRKSHASYRHSIATSVGLPILPFNASTMTAVKRISSTSRALSLTGSINGHTLVNGADSPGTPGLSDSTNASPRTPAPTKVFSKWEKQELEAKAIMKMREANRKKEKEKEAKETKEREEREVKEKAEKERAAAAAEQVRLEKERQEKEKAEKERREKEAAAASSAAPSVPSVIVTAPSIGGTPASETASVPNNFFGLSATAAKPAEGTSSGQAPSIPNFFAKPAEPAKFASADQFSFGMAPGTVAAGEGTSAAVAPGTNSTPSGLTFGQPSGHPQHKSGASGTATAATESTGTSLFSRIGPPGAAEKPQNSLFSFVKSESTPASTPAAPVSTTPATPAASTTNVTMGGIPAATGATTTPKFSFNFGKTATNAALSTTPAASAPVTAMSSTTTPSDKKDNATPMFSFKAPAPVVSATTTPKVGFGASTFGAGGTTTPVSKEPAKPVFGSTTTTTPSFFGGGSSTSANSVFGNTGGSSSAFGNTGSSAAVFGKTNTSSAFGASGSTSSPFGAMSTPSPFGAPNTANAFGTTTTNTSKANENKVFNFANPSSSSVPPSSTSIGTGPNFSSGTTPSTTTPASGGSGFSFKPTTSTTTPQFSPFGAASTGPSVFGKAPETSSTAPSSSSTTAPASVFSFGTTPTSQQK